MTGPTPVDGRTRPARSHAVASTVDLLGDRCGILVVGDVVDGVRRVEPRRVALVTSGATGRRP